MSEALAERPAGNGATDLVASLSREIDAALEALVPADKPVSLIDFPVYSNVGDSAIWVGTLAALKRRGVRLAYVCSFKTWSPRKLSSLIDDGTILLSGGGNFGDRYQPHQDLREDVIRSFPEHRIVQLPQSLWFQAEDALERARRIVCGHRRLTLLIRDRASLAFARREFAGTPSLLCPDMALGLGAIPGAGPSSNRVVWLSRTDDETVAPAPADVPPGVERLDWAGPTPGKLGDWLHRAHVRLRAQPDVMRWLFNPIARARLRRGIAMLAGARCVVTDRLHGHILCLMLGLPHVVLPNRNGKVRAFYEAWTRSSPLAHWCDTEPEALRLALSMRDAAR